MCKKNNTSKKFFTLVMKSAIIMVLSDLSADSKGFERTSCCGGSSLLEIVHVVVIESCLNRRGSDK